MIVLKYIIAFLVVFNFPIPFFYNSSLLAVLICGVVYSIKPNVYLSDFVGLVKTRFVVRIFLLLIGAILLSVVTGVFHQTFDFLIIKGFLLQLTLLLSALIAYPVLSKSPQGNAFIQILSIIIGIFILQSFIQMTAFIVPTVADVVHFFQKPEIAANSKGVRALALSGNPFFDLASAYGLVYILFFKKLIDINQAKFNFINVLRLLLLIAGAMFAGRTAFVGLVTAFVFYLLPFSSKYHVGFRIFHFIIIIIISSFWVMFLFELLPNGVKDIITGRLLPFAFEFLYNYSAVGKLTTNSSEELQQMYYPISLKTFFIGDGRYQGDVAGFYYGNTDAGYMRQVLFFGIGGFFYMVLYQLQFFLKPFRQIKLNWLTSK